MQQTLKDHQTTKQSVVFSKSVKKSVKTSCLTDCAYLNTQKYGLFSSLNDHQCLRKLKDLAKKNKELETTLADMKTQREPAERDKAQFSIKSLST